MIDLDAIRERARRDLVTHSADGRENLQLWEHSARVADAALKIAQLPGVVSGPIDEAVLVATGLYHEAGGDEDTRGADARRFSRASLTSTFRREQSAALSAQSLAELLPPLTLDRLTDCLRTLYDRDCRLIEAQIVADADNLDEFGSLAIWNLACRCGGECRTLSSAIELWEAQGEYGYWTARIKDSFRFDAVRRIALKRLTIFNRQMQELQSHHRGLDIPTTIRGTPRRGGARRT